MKTIVEIEYDNPEGLLLSANNIQKALEDAFFPDTVFAVHALPQAEQGKSIALFNVLYERKLQDAKWGEQNHHPEKWIVILLEELGEASKALLEQQAMKYRDELVHATAVGLAAIEAFDRNKPEQEQAENDCNACANRTPDCKIVEGYPHRDCIDWQPIPDKVKQGTPEDLCASCQNLNKQECTLEDRCTGWVAIRPAKVDDKNLCKLKCPSPHLACSDFIPVPNNRGFCFNCGHHKSCHEQKEK